MSKYNLLYRLPPRFDGASRTSVGSCCPPRDGGTVDGFAPDCVAPNPAIASSNLAV